MIAELDALADPKLREANEKRGDDHGVNLSKLRGPAKRLKTQHELASELWAADGTAANDVTARDLQHADGQWARAKGFDTFCPLGPVIETEFDFIGATVQTRVNDEVKQNGKLSDMVHDVSAIVEYAASVWTLLPGDVILTGTPAGVGPLRDGDTVEVEISGIGVLSNPVIRSK